jgi:hypothetical protein
VRQNRFTCIACDKRSTFTQRLSQPVFEEKVRSPGPYRELITRTYACENCQAENVITQPTAFWYIIDERED